MVDYELHISVNFQVEKYMLGKDRKIKETKK